MDGFEERTELVTPELAARWLQERNHRNRHLSATKVSSYAGDMQAGRWFRTHQNSIAFYADGNLADGQHRLAAIVKSGVSLEMRVVDGLDERAVYGIDAHRMRSTDDQIKLAGNAPWVGKTEVAIARMLMAGASNVSSGKRTAAFSPQQIVAWLEDNKEPVMFAAGLALGSFGSAPVRAAFVTAWYHVPEETLAEFAEVLASGVSMTKAGRTVIALRERFLKETLSHAQGARNVALKLTMRAIEAFARNEVLTKMQVPKSYPYSF